MAEVRYFHQSWTRPRGDAPMPDEPDQHAEYVAALERLLAASVELCNYIGTGMEPAPQSMSVTMGQQAVREFRKAVAVAYGRQIDGPVSGSK